MNQVNEKKITVLFLCAGNSCRSQMAEGLLRHYGGGRFEALSAGSAPAGINPRTVQVMSEIGIDIGDQTSDALDKAMLERADLVVTLCGDARDSCPLTPGSVRRIHRSIKDPDRAGGNEDQIIENFRQVRDQIAKLVQRLIKEKESRTEPV